MNDEDRVAIEGLFARLAEAARRMGPRDPQAEALIAERLRDQPEAPYCMLQAIVGLERALGAAQDRIAGLEADLAARPAGGGLFGGLFGGPAPAPAAASGRPSRAAARLPDASGGGFLAGAAQTAMGVAGGMLVAEALSGLLSPAEAGAEELRSGLGGFDEADRFDDDGDFGED